MFLQYFIQRINLQILAPYSKVISDRVELYSMDSFRQLELFDCFTVAIIDDIQSAFFTSRKNVVSFAGDRVDIGFMDRPYLLAQTADT